MSKIRLGILGGGGDSLSGIVHRIASGMFDEFDSEGIPTRFKLDYAKKEGLVGPDGEFTDTVSKKKKKRFKREQKKYRELWNREHA